MWQRGTSAGVLGNVGLRRERDAERRECDGLGLLQE
jgi:hypothetical protein